MATVDLFSMRFATATVAMYSITYNNVQHNHKLNFQQN